MNLKAAQEIGNNYLIAECAFTIGRAAQEFQPIPEYDIAIASFRLASKKALEAGEKNDMLYHRII